MTTFGRGKQLFLTATKITTWWEITQFDVRVARGVAAYLNAKLDVFSKVIQIMETRQTEFSKEVTSGHMAANWSTLVMYLIP